jgi:antigen flippase
MVKSTAADAASSYRSIFKSTFLVGGAQVINILISLIKNKVLAMILGPAGIGVMGVFTSITTLVSSISNLGINSSAVKQVAEADTAADQPKLAYLYRIIRRLLLFSGLFFALLMCIFSKPLALLSFERDYKPELVSGIIIISLLVLLDNLSTGERAILQGRRKLRELAIGQVLGALIGAVSGVVIIYFLKFEGIAWYLLSTGLSMYLVYRYQVYVINRRSAADQANAAVERTLSATERKGESRTLVKLGLAFLITVLAGSAVSYAERLLIIRSLDVEGVGIYQSAWSLVNMSFNLVLLAMTADFYPRLVSIASDNKAVNRTVNEQVELALLAALPVLLILYVFSPLLLELLYSASFLSGSALCRWLAISCFFRVLCWPLGYIIIAKGDNRLFIVSSIFWEVIQVPILLVCMHYWSLEGIGLTYVISYFLVTIGSTLITARYYQFAWSNEALRSMGVALLLILLVVLADKLTIPRIAFYSLGILGIGFSGWRFLQFVQSKFEIRIIDIIKSRLGL